MAERPTPGPAGQGSRKAAWTLVVLAPTSAEVTFTGVTMPYMWVLLPALVVMYGAGVLLLRELVVRAGGGWPSLLVASLIYELVEDGIGLQALTSPNLYNAADWGPRVLGVNTTYWESQIGYHTVFSVLIPVLLADLLFPRHRGRPYLRRGGLVAAAVAAVVGVGLLRVGVAAVEDPGYQTPLPAVVGILAAVAVLFFVALRVLPARTAALSAPPRGGHAPRPAVVGILAGAAAACFLALLMPSSAASQEPAVGTGAWVLVPMAVAAAVAVCAGCAVHRWSGAADWSGSHWVWLVGGALIGRTLYAMATEPISREHGWGHAGFALMVGTVMIALMVFLLRRLDRRLVRRTGGADAPAAPSR